MRNLYTKFNISPESLTGCRFFGGLEPAERVEVVRHCEGRRYRKGGRILSYGDSTRDVFFLCAGHVRAIVLSTNWDADDCEVLTSQELDGGEMFGELSAIDGEPRSTSVVAVEESSVPRMSSQAFREFISRYPVLNQRTMLRLCALSRYLCDRSRRVPTPFLGKSRWKFCGLYPPALCQARNGRLTPHRSIGRSRAGSEPIDHR